jgi:hypothetical protein
MTGGCFCGAVRYQVAANPLLVYACHCTDCQTQSGSAFALNMAVPADSFRLTAGQAKAWRRVSPSYVRTASWFCPDCGGRLYGERDGRPEAVNIRAGTLDDTAWVEPAFHMYLRSAQPWMQRPDSGQCFGTVPDDFRALSKAWQTQMGFVTNPR